MLPGVNIANTGTVEGNAGQRSAEVMVSLSQVATDPCTIIYRTRDVTASAGSDYVASNGTVAFAKGDIMKKIFIPVNGDLDVETNENLEIILSNVSGATLTDSIGTVTIVNDDFAGSSPLSVYEVRFTYTGYTSFSVGPSKCPIRSNGKVVLTGLLAGRENVPADDDISYTGTLQLDIDIDICSATGEEDNAKVCGITVVGSGLVKADLDIYFDGRGGYIKTNGDTSQFTRSLYGSCDRDQIREEHDMVPNKTIASVFNGRDLPMLIERTLKIGRYVESDDGIETVVEVLRKIR